MSLLYCRCAALIDTDEDPDGAEGQCEACRVWTAEDEAALRADIERADRKAEC